MRWVWLTMAELGAELGVGLGAGLGLALWATVAAAQGVGFLTEQERLASYCAGVS